MKRALLITIVAALAIVTALFATEVLIRNAQVYTGLSTDTKTTSGIIVGSTWYEHDTGRTYYFNGTTWVMRSMSAATDTTTMRAPATSSAVFCKGFTKATWYFKIATINTSVGVALQARKSNGDWYCVEQDSVVYTSNGNKGLTWSSVITADSLRFKWISEGGGTDAVITHHVGLGGDN